MAGMSPLKIKPLRNPGQSLDEALARIREDGAFGYLIYASGFAVIAAMEWVGYLLDSPRYPKMFTAIALVALAIAVFKLQRLRKDARNIVLGRDGERVVGQFLEELRVDGASIFHDVPGDGFNLDHVVITDRGVVVVETKTHSKSSPHAKVTFVGEQLLIAGWKPDRDPIQQVRAQIAWISRILQQSTGKSFPVRGALVYPNWWVDPAPEGVNKDVWVLEPKALPAFIKNEPVRLVDSDVKLATFHLSQYIRSKA